MPDTQGNIFLGEKHLLEENPLLYRYFLSSEQHFGYIWALIEQPKQLSDHQLDHKNQ